MLEFHEKRRLQRVIYSRPSVLLLAMLLGLLVYAAWNAYGTEREQAARQQDLSQKLAGLEARKAELSKSITALDDPRGVEAGLRERYDVGKEGEQSIILIENGEEESQQVDETTSTQKGFWQRLLDIVF